MNMLEALKIVRDTDAFVAHPKGSPRSAICYDFDAMDFKQALANAVTSLSLPNPHYLFGEWVTVDLDEWFEEYSP